MRSLKRNDNDTYYTSPNYAEQVWDKLTRMVDVDSFDFIVEPSAGRGSFFNLLPDDKRIGLDIDPQCNGVTKQDLLTWQPPICAPQACQILTVGNPPFGVQSTSAIKHFNYCATFSQYISFLLPRSFRKDSIQNSLDRSFVLLHDEDVPDNSYIWNNEAYNVKSCWQVWKQVKKESNRTKKEYQAYEYDRHFEFVKEENTDANMAIRRIGYNSGRITWYDQVGKICHGTSFYYVHVKTEQAKDVFQKLDFSIVRENTGGGKSISRSEIIEKFLGEIDDKQKTKSKYSSK